MKISGQGQGHRDKKIGYFGSFLRICSNSSYSYAWIWLLSHRNVQKGHTKKRKKPEFWIFARVDFYRRSKVENGHFLRIWLKNVIFLHIKCHEATIYSRIDHQHPKSSFVFFKYWKLTNLEAKLCRFWSKMDIFYEKGKKTFIFYASNVIRRLIKVK